MGTDYKKEIQEQLDRLDDLKSPKGLRERTIRALAEGAVMGWSRGDVLDRKETVSRRTFYSKGKDWYHNALFKEVLERVERLYIHRDGEEREKAAEAEAAARHAERAALIRKGKAKVSQLFDQMDLEGATASQVASLFKAVLDQERTEFDEQPPDKHDFGWRDKLPEGGSVADAEQAMQIMVQAIASGELVEGAEPDEHD